MSAMSSQLHNDLEETANRALRIAAAIKHDLAAVKSINERIGAVRTGRVIKPSTCETCERNSRPHGHHTDYSKALDVVWMCTKCHGEVHHAHHRD